MKAPLVSLVMPTMNSAAFIGETFFSLLDQVYENFELIVIDGASTDNTLQIVADFADEKVKVIELPPGLGIAAAMNAGIAASEGRFIARMDADDIAYKWRIHDQVYFLLSNPEIDLVGTGADAFGDHEGVYRSPQTYRDIRNEFLVNNPFFHPTIMFRRKLVDQGLYQYDEAFFFEEDYELWGRLLPKVKCANLDQSSIRYRIRGNSTQWDPRKYSFKRQALQGFCAAEGITDEVLIDGLAEFQCSAFVRHEHYAAMHRYAIEVDDVEDPRPKLGWLQAALVGEPDYAAFTKWLRHTKGWPS